MIRFAAFALTAALSASALPVEPALGPVAPTAAGAAHPVSVSFETDPRVELLAVLVALAQPDGVKFSPGVTNAREEFSRFAGHPAVVRVREELAHRGGGELTEVFLLLSQPPELAAPEDLEGARRSAPFADFLKEARDFAKTTRFERFYKKNAPIYASLAEKARLEASRGLRPDSVAAYLRRDDAGRHRFILSPLLPPKMGANAAVGPESSRQYLRVRGGTSRLGFDLFGAGAAHEAAHDMLDPLTLGRPELEAYSDLMYDGCAGSWNGCVLEHMDLAVTLRALAAERGEPVSADMLAAYAPKYPYLAALTRRLGEWEKKRDGTFADFYPRLLSVFREALAARASAPGSKPPRRRRPR